jgi:BirA family biotin operon repressor/biotin-[acetyl-CoA-carboxylase] ligase
VDRLMLLRAVLERLAGGYPDLTGSEPDRLYAGWSARLAWSGERVVAYLPEGELHGLMEGADDDGALRLRLDNGEIRRVRAGDVRLRTTVGG